MIPQAAVSRITSPLMIRLFGAFDAVRGDVPLPRTRTRKEQWLLAFLALRPGQALDRDWLAGLFWPDTPQKAALGNLRRSLTDLRRVLGEDASCLMAPTSRTVSFDPAGTSVDVLEFDSAAARGDAVALQQVVALYRGPLLEGCFEEWALREREAREQTYLDALDTLAEMAMARGEPQEAVRCLRRALPMDPLREPMQRALIAALAASGDYGAATQTYRDFRILLHRELNAEPTPETTALYRQLQIEARCHARAAPPGPTRSPSASPVGRIPRPLSSLIGRERETAEVRSCISTARLVTLTGTGGVGKTRLAIRVAEEVVEDHIDGVWFIDLAPLADSTLISQALATVLGIREEPGHPLIHTLIENLKRKSLLLVVDNCEHLVEACARLVDALLAGCSHVRILATSREALGVTGEIVWRVPSLSVPHRDRMGFTEKDTLSVLMEHEAIRLFVERAALAQPNFRVTNENLRAAARVCAGLDGIPLAIELAAARAKALSVQEIAARLEDRFRLLAGGSRTALPRQQTLRATLDWSYDLLTEAEKRVFRRLSVFAGGWTLEAAEALCMDDRIDRFEALDLLTHLLDKSLVVYEELDGQGRYRLLETVRQYGSDMLKASGEIDAVRTRHLDFFLEMAEETEPQLMGPGQIDSLARLEVEHDNLRAALDYCQEAGHVETALRMAGALWRFWRTRDYHTEGCRRLTDALTPEQAAGPTELRAKALNSLAVLSAHQGDYAAAQVLYSESLSIRRTLGDERGIAVALENLGIVANDMGDFSASRSLHAEAVSIHRRRGDKGMLAGTLSNAGYTAFAQSDYASARSFDEESLLLHRDRGNEWGAATALDNLGDVERAEGDLDAARARHAEALAIAHGLGDERLVAQILEGLARTAAAQGQAARAARIFGFEETLRERLGSPLPLLERDKQLCSIAAVRNALDTASFEQTWSEGRALTLEQAIEFALNNTET